MLFTYPGPLLSSIPRKPLEYPPSPPGPPVTQPTPSPPPPPSSGRYIYFSPKELAQIPRSLRACLLIRLYIRLIFIAANFLPSSLPWRPLPESGMRLKCLESMPFFALLLPLVVQKIINVLSTLFPPYP